jgi:hypothetical protein
VVVSTHNSAFSAARELLLLWQRANFYSRSCFRWQISEQLAAIAAAWFAVIIVVVIFRIPVIQGALSTFCVIFLVLLLPSWRVCYFLLDSCNSARFLVVTVCTAATAGDELLLLLLLLLLMMSCWSMNRNRFLIILLLFGFSASTFKPPFIVPFFARHCSPSAS